jgi:uncharacterized protein
LKTILILLTFLVSLYSDTKLASPIPTIDNPRKILFSIIKEDDKLAHHILTSANNVLKYYGPEKVHMKIVVYSEAIRALLKSETKFKARIEALMLYDVEFVTCANTMRTKGITKEMLLDDIEIVTAGIVELIERVKEGWVYIKP